jgi:hypothetical protein
VFFFLGFFSFLFLFCVVYDRLCLGGVGMLVHWYVEVQTNLWGPIMVLMSKRAIIQEFIKYSPQQFSSRHYSRNSNHVHHKGHLWSTAMQVSLGLGVLLLAFVAEGTMAEMSMVCFSHCYPQNFIGAHKTQNSSQLFFLVHQSKQISKLNKTPHTDLEQPSVPNQVVLQHD